MKRKTSPRTRRSRSTRPRATRTRTLLFEPLEPRLLLSASPFFTAAQAPAALDLILRHEHEGGIDTLALVDRQHGTVASRAITEIDEMVEIVGSAFDDLLTLDLDPD